MGGIKLVSVSIVAFIWIAFFIGIEVGQNKRKDYDCNKQETAPAVPQTASKFRLQKI
jgi:hypothetical protein